MDMPDIMALGEASLFVAGLAAIHGLRRHAEAVTTALGLAAVTLTMLVGIASLPPGMLARHGNVSVDPELLVLAHH